MITIILLAVTVSSVFSKVEHCYVCHYGSEKEAMALQKLMRGSNPELAEYEDKDCGKPTGVVERCPHICATGTVEDEQGNRVAVASGCFDGDTAFPKEIDGKKAKFHVCVQDFCNDNKKKLRTNKTSKDSKPKKSSDDEDSSDEKVTTPSIIPLTNTTANSVKLSAKNEITVDALTTKSKPVKALDPTTKKRVLKRTTRSARVAKDTYAKPIPPADDCTTTTPKPKSAAAIFSGIKIITLCAFLRVLY
ncbi:unnamed protein product [Bursaphelenchus xylophilus]|uniref:(pine wood nematode) hypothetical protein n=1 Tax=Bursaphelenchus xylophilus TaxID=6326 RepID=A0A1I7SL88_BURXY|nr:unnamed protein product [Bursaphelenchus xylophilus]CAG9129415.1 unnamed protein product [Bursaphelenchus xylophilus]